MRPSNLVPSFYFYKLADALSGPYTALAAYSAGVIDAKGNILKPESSIDAFEYLVIKLKKIIDQLPYGMTKAQLGNYLSAIHYFSEEFEKFEITQEQFHCMIEGFVCQATNNEVSYLELLEDMSVGAGGGAPGSLGTPIANSQGPGVAGYDPKLGMPMQRRKQPKYFDNCEVFEVCPEEFIQFKAAKQWKDIPEGENKNYIQRFQRRNKNTKVAIKSLNPLNGEHEMHWISYPAHNFMENVDLNILNVLLETKKQSRVRDHEDDHEQFKSHILSLMGLHENEKSLARKTEYEARILNHIKNYHAVKSNPTHLKSYIDTTHQTILNSASANSSDTNSVHFDDKGNMSLKTIDVKDIGQGDSYVSIEIPKSELSSIPALKGMIDTSTESGETRIRRQGGKTSALKKAIEDHYKKNPQRNVERPKEGSYMIKRSDGRFYMAGPEVLSPTTERKIRLSETGHQRRARKANQPNPHPELRRVTARQAMRILDPKKQKPNLTPISLSNDEYSSTRSLFTDDHGSSLDQLLKPHFE